VFPVALAPCATKQQFQFDNDSRDRRPLQRAVAAPVPEARARHIHCEVAVAACLWRQRGLAIRMKIVLSKTKLTKIRGNANIPS
jgi:hypothetical protein